MKHKIFTLFVLAGSLTAHAQNACPEKTPSEWAEYFIGRSSNLAGNLSTFEDMWENCEATFRLNGVQACAERILKKARQTKYTRSNGHSMGWEMSDRDYLRSVPEGYLDLPPELSDGLPDNIREIAAQKGWKYMRYRSRTVGNPPNGSYERALLLIPGETVDKWIQFTVPENGGRAEQLVDFIALEKATGPNDKPTPYFTQYWRDRNGRNPQQRSHGSFDNCYSCHPGGMRELSPQPGSYSAEDGETLKFMQETMSNYILGRGGVDWGEALHPEEYGPPMGERQGCVKCHNNGEGTHEQSRGAITTRHDRGHIRHKMLEDKTMPVSMLPMEEAFFDFIRDIPNQLNETELAEFQNTMRNVSQRQVYDRSIDFMKNKNKITNEDATRYKYILNGHPSYPNCEDQPDCYKGLSRYDDYFDQMYADYGDQLQSWLVEPCEAVLSGTNPTRIAEPRRNSSGYEAGFESGINGQHGSER